MNRTVTIVFALSVGVAIGVTGGSRLFEPRSGSSDRGDDLVQRRARRHRGTGHLRSVRGAAGLAERPQPRCRATRSGPMAERAASSPRARTACSCSAAASCRRWRARRRKFLTDVGPNVQFPIAGLPWRNANTASPPGAGGSRQDPEKGMEMWRGSAPPYRELGVDARWHHSIIVVDAQGNITEDWTQWDNMFKRPHAVYISPYDAQKRVWIVDDHTHAIYIFSNDGKQLLQTIGTPNVPGADATHFNRPTFMAWLPDGTFYRGRRLQRHARREVRCQRQVPARLRHAGRSRQGDAARLHEQRARRRRRRRDAPRVRQRSRQQPHSDLRRERQVSLRVEDHGAAVEPALRADRR